MLTVEILKETFNKNEYTPAMKFRWESGLLSSSSINCMLQWQDSAIPLTMVYKYAPKQVDNFPWLPPFGDEVGHVFQQDKQRVTPVWCG